LDILINTIQNIPSVQDTETLVSLDQAIERQVWVKDYPEAQGYHGRQKAKGAKKR
jgi:Lrp/AsnC family transcriptional regulator for asnA, asnC and gidA